MVTAHGYGSFYSNNAGEGIFSLWTFMVTLVVTMLLISVLQSERTLAEKALRNNEKKLRAVIDGALEGVENIEQFEMLKKFGCRYFQGFYFSKPLKIDDFERLVERS